MQDNAPIPAHMTGEQFNLTELARAMAEEMPEFSYKAAHTFLDMLLMKVVPDVLATGKPIILHGFGTFYVHKDHIFQDPSTLDPNDRIAVTKVHFRSSPILDKGVQKIEINE